MNIFYPLEYISNLITYNILNLTPQTHLADSIQFIIADLLKIFLLLSIMIYLVSYLRTYINPENTRKKLSGKKGILYHFGASGLGVISPFCSCSSIPLFLGFIQAGVPLGITFSFLITSPLVNEAAIAILWATFGLKAMLLYVISGVLIGVIGGMIIHYLKLEKYVEDFVYKIKAKHELEEIKQTPKQRNKFATNEVKSIVKKVWIYIIIGVSIGGFMHGYLPENFIAKYLGVNNPLAVPLAILVGIPIYSNVLGTIPIIESLIGKGLPLGTALAFLMSVTAISFPELIILKKVLKTRLILIFTGIITVSIIFTGYLFNIIL